MRRLKILIVLLFICLFVACKNKKNNIEITPETSISEIEDNYEVESKYIKQQGEAISFYYNEKFYTKKRTEYYKFPDLKKYPVCWDVTLLASGENNLHESGEINQKKSKEKSHYQF